MEQLPGTPQDVKYVWHGRKPFRLPEGREIKQGETFTPTVEMIAAFRDLMLPVGDGSGPGRRRQNCCRQGRSCQG